MTRREMTEAEMDEYISLLVERLPQRSPYITDAGVSQGSLYAVLAPGSTKANIRATVPATVTISDDKDAVTELDDGTVIMKLDIDPTHARANHNHLVNAGP